MTLTWVTSAGGPLLVAPQSVLPQWIGVTDNDGPVETWGDYGRACSVEGYIGRVAIGERQGLVLGDEPAMTAYLPTQRLFVRWVAAYQQDELVTTARQAVRSGVEWDDDPGSTSAITAARLSAVDGRNQRLREAGTP